MMRNASLGAKLAGVLVLLFVVLGAIGLGVASWGTKHYSDEVHHRLNRAVSGHIAKQFRPFANDTIDQTIVKKLFMDVMVINPSLEVYLLDEQGRVLAYDAPEEKILRHQVNLAPIRKFLAAGGDEVVAGDDPRHATRTKPITVQALREGEKLRGYLYIVLGGEIFDSITAALANSYILRLGAVLLIASLVIAIALGLFAIGALTRPLRELRHAMARFQRTGQPVQLPAGGKDEVAALTRGFNDMAVQIADQVGELKSIDEKRRQFIASISHDLRTPTAAVQGYLETLITRGERLDADARERYLRNALRQNKRLAKLVDQLFELARLEAEEVAPNLEVFSLAELVQDVVEKFQVSSAGRLDAEFPYDLPDVRADIALVERVLDNLIENALRFGKPGGRVRIVLSPDPRGVRVSVRDNGPGIAPEDAARVFDRFYRAAADDAGSKGGGAGLGLAIAQRILRLHESSIRLKTRLGVGSAFSFVLPTGRSAALSR